jgi:hypothetical protein
VPQLAPVQCQQQCRPPPLLMSHQSCSDILAQVGWSGGRLGRPTCNACPLHCPLLIWPVTQTQSLAPYACTHLIAAGGVAAGLSLLGRRGHQG